MHVFDEIHHVKGVPQLEADEAPHCVAAIITAGHKLVWVEWADSEAVDALHVVGQGTEDQPEDFSLNEVPNADHSVLAAADCPQ